MKKLKLDVDTLVVESFAPSSPAPAHGTVEGHGYTEATCPTENADFTCSLYQTCRQPCGFSDATNCHRCTENQTGVSICPDMNSHCIC